MCANCHVVTVQTEMNNLQAIKNACKRLGWQFQENQATYKWYGRWADDSPVPRHIFHTQAEYDSVIAMTSEERRRFMTNYVGHCDHAIKVPKCDYEIGVIDMGNGKLVPTWDWYDTRLNTAVGKDGCVLVQAYSVERTKLEAQYHGHTCQEQQLKDGSIQLCIQLGDL